VWNCGRESSEGYFVTGCTEFKKNLKIKVSCTNLYLREVELINMATYHKRKKIVAFAYNNIPFYTEFYNSKNFHPNQLVTQGDWDLVPTINKKDIRDNYNAMVNSNINAKRHIISSTGGTSGSPLKVLHDKKIIMM
tara:strand:- start:999 stop:1406 length:408 start_codon:yes stop_codon:yes gene_type:complete